MALSIALFSGGLSPEREISLMSGRAVKKALDSLLYNVVEMDLDINISEKIKEISPDLAFIALHGSYGEDGCIQGLLEILNIKYTHSGIMASAIAIDKVMSKHIFKSLGIDIPNGNIIERKDILKNKIEMNYPYVLKPIRSGSSIGTKIIFSHKDYLDLKKNSSSILKRMIIEKYIHGIELHTAVILDEAIGTIEIRSRRKFYDYKAKYTSGLTEYIFPPKIPKRIYKMTLKHASTVHKFLGCKTISRSDFIYNPDEDRLKMLEINTHPGLTELSVVPKLAKLAKGIQFNELISIIIKDSLIN